jgi:magnesium chelatase subunit I
VAKRWAPGSGDRKVDKRSGVSQRLPITTLEHVVSNAERRALANGEQVVVPRVTDLRGAGIHHGRSTEYEGEPAALSRSHAISSVRPDRSSPAAEGQTTSVVEWFDPGGALPLADTTSAFDGQRREESMSDRSGQARASQVCLQTRAPRSPRRPSTSSWKVYAQKKISCMTTRLPAANCAAAHVPARGAGCRRKVRMPGEEEVP